MSWSGRTATGRRAVTRTVALAAVLAVVTVAALWWVLSPPAGNRLRAVFTGAVGLYEGNDVRVLGVRVGTVDRVAPQGDVVLVDLVIDQDVTIPADARAVIVAPSVVSDRYVQLAPAYTGGPAMASGTVIPQERTTVPLEVDDLYASLNQVSATLGPNGANRDGALSELLTTLANNAEGNGQALHDTITSLSDLSATLSGNAGDLFATVDNLQKLTTTLAGRDAAVRQFSEQMTGVTAFLAAERGDLAATIDQLGVALGMVHRFIDANRDRIRSNVDKLAAVTQVLVDQRAALAETLDVAPLGLSNIINTYNGSSGTLDARGNLNELNQPPIVLVCRLLRQGTPGPLPPVLAETCDQLAPVVDGMVALPTPAQAVAALQEGHLPALPLPLAGALYGTPAGAR